MTDYTLARTNMVDCQVRPADVTDLKIIDAMLEIPREQFVPEQMQALAYLDEDLSLNTSTSTQDGDCPRYLMEPASFAKLLQLAQITPDSIVLDIGCASGYSTAVLASLCSSVVAVEEDEKLANFAIKNLEKLEIGNGVVLASPLQVGYPKEGPYDVIFIGGAVEIVPQILTDQLKDGGRLVCVIGTGNTGCATLYVRAGDNVSKTTHFNCAVWPLPAMRKQKQFVF